MAYMRWLEELGRDSVPIAGGKGTNLGEMHWAALPMPPGFVVTTDAFDRFITGAGLLARTHTQRHRAQL